MTTSTANYDFTSHMKMSLRICQGQDQDQDQYQVHIYHTYKCEKLVTNISISWVWAFICELFDIKGKERKDYYRKWRYFLLKPELHNFER